MLVFGNNLGPTVTRSLVTRFDSYALPSVQCDLNTITWNRDTPKHFDYFFIHISWKMLVDILQIEFGKIYFSKFQEKMALVSQIMKKDLQKALYHTESYYAAFWAIWEIWAICRIWANGPPNHEQGDTKRSLKPWTQHFAFNEVLFKPNNHLQMELYLSRFFGAYKLLEKVGQSASYNRLGYIESK